MIKAPYIPRSYDKWALKNWERFCRKFGIVDYKEFSLKNRDDNHELFDHPLSFVTKNGDGIIVTQPFLSRDDILNRIKRDGDLVQDCIERNCKIYIFETCKFNWRAVDDFVVFFLPKDVDNDEVKDDKTTIDVTVVLHSKMRMICKI